MICPESGSGMLFRRDLLASGKFPHARIFDLGIKEQP
jgi:hypothetical protein